MKWILWIFIVLLVLFLLIIITKIKVKIRYQHVRDNDELIIKLSAWFGLIRYTFDIPVINVDMDSAAVEVQANKGTSDQTKKEDKKEFSSEDLVHTFNTMKKIIQHIVGFHKIIRHFLKKVQVKQFEWNSRIGIGDAAHTGTLVGTCWAIKGSVIGLLTTTLNFRVMPLINITPDFQEQRAETAILCILRFRIGQAIMTGIKLLRYWKGSKAELFSDTLAKQKDNSNNQSM